MGAETIALIGSGLVGGAGSYFGGEAQADAMNSGAKTQADLARWTYGQDRQREYDASQYLKNFLPNLSGGNIDPNQYFGEGGINSMYDIAKTNLTGSMNTATTGAASQAGALAAARGFANPSGFVANQTNQVRTGFAPQFGQLEMGRAGALQQNQGNLYKALFDQLQFGNQMNNLNFQNRFNLASQFGSPNVNPSQADNSWGASRQRWGAGGRVDEYGNPYRP